MSQVSRRRLKPEIEQHAFSILSDVISGETISFIRLFLTPTEKIMLAKRVAIAILVKRGYSYSLIKDYLKVSQGTVAMIIRQLKTSSLSDQAILDRIIRHKRFIEAVNEFEYLMESLIPPKGRDWTIWRRNLEKAKRLSELPI